MASQPGNANFFTTHADNASVRRWLIALAIAVLLIGGLWALWSIGPASASASDAPAIYSPPQNAGNPPPAPDQHKQPGHSPSVHFSGNPDLSHLPYLGEIHGANWSDSSWFIPPSEIHPRNTMPVDGNAPSFPVGGNWHDFGNQSMGLGIGGPGGGGGPSANNFPGDPHSAEDPSGPSDSSDTPSQKDDDSGISPNALQAPGELTSGVPEPATWAMMLLGFGAIGFAMRRQKELASAV